ncbi:hypothetical protein TNCV_311051 [Trichonephila clavipes]|nr:hypothetical protein TNCV_311051 [Trichonephila clavipes]
MTVRIRIITSLAIRGYFHPFKVPCTWPAKVVETTQLQLRSGMKCLLTGWQLSLCRSIASASSCKSHSDLNHDSSIRHQLPANFHPLSQIDMHCHLAYSKFRYLKSCSFASFIHTSLLGLGWKRVAINSGPKNPKDMLKKRRVNPSQRDEAHFWLNGYVNKQNCRIWSEANPQVYVETPLHPEKLTVWCALWAGGIIGPYFFKNDEGHNELGFQQDGATCHTARATIDLLKDTFGDRLISRFGPVNWPPRSCDLTPLDYFLWGYVKSLVYADKPQTLDHLEDNFRRVIADIRPQMLEKVIENWTSRLDYIRASRGSPMPEILFKM